MVCMTERAFNGRGVRGCHSITTLGAVDRRRAETGCDREVDLRPSEDLATFLDLGTSHANDRTIHNLNSQDVNIADAGGLRNNQQVTSQPRPKIGQMIRSAREARGLSQDELAELLPGKCRGNQVSKWERGDNRPSQARLDTMVEVLGLDANEAREAWFSYLMERAKRQAEGSQPPPDK